MNFLDQLTNKIVIAEKAVETISSWRKANRKVVFTNGCFDLLHLGHIEYLAKAASFGDYLVIGVNTDASVRRLKGKSRPVNDEKSRSLVLASMGFVSLIVLFSEDTPYELIKTLQPDVLIKGADYQPEQIVGYDIVKARGGEVLTIEFIPGYSSSAIEKRILDAHTSQL